MRLAVGDALLDGGAELHFLAINLLVAAPPLEKIIERPDDAEADDVVVQRDVPEPALLVGRLNDDGRPFIPADVAVRPLPIGPDGPLVQHRIPEPELEPVLQHGALPAGIHDDLGPHLLPCPSSF